MCEEEKRKTGCGYGMGIFCSFLFGTVTGAILGILFAPHSGKRTKQNIANFIEDMEDKGKDMIDKGKELIEKGEEFLDKKKEKNK